MSTLDSGVTRAPRADVLSPELVLVDPALAERARQRLADPDDTLARLGHLASAGRTAASTYSNGDSSSAFDDAVAAAVRRLAQASLDAPVSERAAVRRRRLRRLVAVTAVFFATFALALFVTDLQTEAEVPAKTEISALGEPPVTADVGKAPELRSSSGPTERPRAPRSPPSDTSAPSGPSARHPTSIPQRFAWAPADGASGYHVELFRGMSRVFAADTARPQITIPAKWTHAGRQYRLEAVEYRWYVWPIVSGKRASRATVQARLVVRDR